MHLEEPAEMNILVAGNSQVACLKSACRLFPEVTRGIAGFSFYCFPGGWGPSFVVEKGRLAIIEGSVNKDHPPFADPPETPDRPIDEFDVIVVSALGSIGGGFGYTYDLMWRGALYEFGPKHNPLTERPVSKSCYREMIRFELSRQHGFQFLRHLRKKYRGRIVVQPFPRISEVARERPDWCLNTIYEDAIGAHGFFSEIRDRFLEELCAELSIDLLPYPEDGWRNDHFTPAEFFEHTDGIHPGSQYGKLILEQILDRVKPTPPSDEATREREREVISNLEKYSDIDFISLGEDGFCRTICAQWGLRKCGGPEAPCFPFDRAFHPLPKIAALISSNFSNYLAPGDLRFLDDRKFCRNDDLNISFNHEVGEEYSLNDFALLRKTYERRIENFRKRLSQGGRIVFLLHLSKPRPNAVLHIKRISQALKSRCKADALLICINPSGAHLSQEDAQLQLLPSESIRIVDAPYPWHDYLWHSQNCSFTPEGHEYEKQLVSAVKAIVDRWK
jgi:hypothetical protein